MSEAPTPVAPTRAVQARLIDPGLAIAFRDLTAAKDVDAIARVLLAAIDNNTRPDAVGILAEGPDGWRTLVHRGLPDTARNARIPLDGPIAERMCEGGGLHIADFRAAGLRPFGATYLVPCADRGKAPLLVAIAGNDAAVTWVKAIAPIAGLATRIASTAVATPAPTPVEVVRRVEVPIAVGIDWPLVLPMLRTTSIPDLLDHIVNVAKSLVGAEKATVMLKDDATGELVVRAVRGIGDERTEKRISRGETREMRIKPGQGLPGKVFESGKAAMVRAPRADNGQPGVTVGLPMSADGEIVGVLLLNETTTVEFLPDDGGDIGHFATLATAALRRTQLTDLVARDPITGFAKLPFVEHQATLAAREPGPLCVLWWGIGTADGKAADDKRLAKVVAPLRRALGDHADRCTVVGGSFGAVLAGLDGPTGMRFAARICNEMGTRHYGEMSWCFAVSERKPSESGVSLLHRGREELARLVSDKPGIRFSLDGKETAG